MKSPRTRFPVLALLVLALLAPKQAEAHAAMLYPMPRGGVTTKDFDWNIHSFIGYKGLKFPCGGYKRGPNTSTSFNGLFSRVLFAFMRYIVLYRFLIYTTVPFP